MSFLDNFVFCIFFHSLFCSAICFASVFINVLTAQYDRWFSNVTFSNHAHKIEKNLSLNMPAEVCAQNQKCAEYICQPKS